MTHALMLGQIIMEHTLCKDYQTAAPPAVLQAMRVVPFDKSERQLHDLYHLVQSAKYGHTSISHNLIQVHSGSHNFYFIHTEL